MDSEGARVFIYRIGVRGRVHILIAKKPNWLVAYPSDKKTHKLLHEGRILNKTSKKCNKR